MTHKRCTRSSSSDKLSIPLYLTNRAQRSIKYQGSKTWNSILAVIRCLKLKKFSQKYRVQKIYQIPGFEDLEFDTSCNTMFKVEKVFSKISRAIINFIS